MGPLLASNKRNTNLLHLLLQFRFDFQYGIVWFDHQEDGRAFSLDANIHASELCLYKKISSHERRSALGFFNYTFGANVLET